MFDPAAETRPVDEQFRLDRESYRAQIAYLFERSPFYRRKLDAAGFPDAKAVGELDDIARLPFTEKDELRATQAAAPPFGEHLAVEPERLVRVFSTSGTTGVPCYLGLTRSDLEIYATNVARGYSAAGFSRGQRVAVGFNAGPFVAGAVYHGFDLIGCTVIPVGTGNTERLVSAIVNLKATGVSCTPSYGLYLIDWCHDAGIDTRSLGLTNMITAGEPGGGDPLIRARIEEAFGCRVRESMGIGDISLSAWAEDEDGGGMHFMARDFVHVELIDPTSGEPIDWRHGAEGELVYTALRREAMPLLRFRSRDHVVVNMEPNPTGRTGPRIRCIGRTDDMLIVRGVNLFPSAVQDLVESMRPAVSGQVRLVADFEGHSTQRNLTVLVERAEAEPTGLSLPALKDEIERRIRGALAVKADVLLAPHGSIEKPGA
ncbi:MAG TPA: hypothetical protein VF210_04230, partial [Pseudomonadales bacterium]